MRPLALACLAALLCATPARAIQADAAYRVEEVRFRAADGVELIGSLLVPDGEGPFPGAVIIHGSGESDRSNVWADAFARLLARSGAAALLPDKRGSGESGGDWRTASFETLARDALAGVDLVAAHPKVDRREVGVVGLSQGGHVAPLAADLSDEVAWVVDVSGATVPMIEQIRHEMANTARHAGLSPEGVEAVLYIQRAAERYVETDEWDPYAAELDAAEGTPWAEVAAGFPQSPDSPVWTWARLNGAYDPIPHWKALEVPILVFYGAEDESDNVPVAESVRRLEAALAEAGHEDFGIRVIPGAGHGIWAPDTDHSAHDHRLHPDLAEALTAWIDERFGGDAGGAAGWSDEVSTAVDSLVTARLDAERIPGAAVAFVVGGELVHAKGYGVADTATGRPVDFDRTLWRIGSTTKALTGLALAALVEREGIDLDADVSAWLDPGLLPDGSPITFRHLLTHSAGFDQTGLGRRTEEPAPRPTLERFLREELVRVRPPGAVGVYDTYGITLAGHLIERIGGLAYPAHMRREVFEPLGMTRTWVETPDSTRGDLAVGYGLEDGALEPQGYEWYVTLPASSVDATAADMARLLSALLTDGGGPVSADLARRVRSEPQLVYGPDMGAFSWAFWEERRDGRRAIHHGGIMAGYSSGLYLVPDAGVGFFVAYNRDPETGPAPRLRDALTDFLHARVVPAGESVPPPVEPLPVPSERFAGAYGNTVGCFRRGRGMGDQHAAVHRPRAGRDRDGGAALAGGRFDRLPGGGERRAAPLPVRRRGACPVHGAGPHLVRPARRGPARRGPGRRVGGPPAGAAGGAGPPRQRAVDRGRRRLRLAGVAPSDQRGVRLLRRIRGAERGPADARRRRLRARSRAGEMAGVEPLLRGRGARLHGPPRPRSRYPRDRDRGGVRRSVPAPYRAVVGRPAGERAVPGAGRAAGIVTRPAGFRRYRKVFQDQDRGSPDR